ncbi:amidase [Photobacterium sp. DNB22_13_2]
MMDQSVYCSQGPSVLPSLSSRGVLQGYEFVFKDLFDVEGYITGAGNPAWLATHQPAKQTSPLILSLLANGAKCVGRVQTDELAYSLNGQNVHYGTPFNPVAPQCLPGGSSSGSAVAVARGDAHFAIGTDTGGSIRVPASYCGLFGWRPTHGALSLDHAFSLAPCFDTAGVLARDMAVLEKVAHILIPEEDCRDPMDEQTVLGMAVDRGLFDLVDQTVAAEIQPILKKLEDGFRDQCYVSVLAKCGVTTSELAECFRVIQGRSIIDEHRDWLSAHKNTLGSSIAERVDMAFAITDEQYSKALVQQEQFKQRLLPVMASLGGWLLIPTTPGLPPLRNASPESLVMYRQMLLGFTAIAGLCGLPQLHLPLSRLDGKPFGVSLLGLPGSDLALINQGKRVMSCLSRQHNNKEWV